MSPFEVVVFVMLAVSSLAVVSTHDPLKQAMNASLFGMLLVVMLFMLQAPDVALSMIVAEAMVLPLMVLLALSKVSSRGRRRRT
jgi:uncharacterized MnhB-related membrane protein